MIKNLLNKLEKELSLLDLNELSNNENYPEILFNLLFLLSCLSKSEYRDCIKRQFYDLILKEMYVNKSRFRLSFYNGMAGVVFLLENNTLKSRYSDLLIQDFNKTISDNMSMLLPFFKKEKKEYEFFGGLLGIIYYYSQRKTQTSHKEMDLVEKSLNKVLKFVREEIDNRILDVSLVHGTISFLKIFHNYMDKVGGANDIYIQMMDSYLKLVIDKEKFEQNFGGRMGWCKSRASVLLLLYLLPVEEEKLSRYLYKELLNIFESSNIEWKYDNPYLCHGYAGMSIMMCAFNYIGKNRTCVRDKLYEELHMNGDLVGDIITSPNIIENRLGILLALINDSSKNDILNKVMLMV